MHPLDWSKAPANESELKARYAALIQCDPLELLTQDPRDLVIADMLYLHPEPMPVSWQIDGGPGYNAIFGQLALSDLIDAGLMSRSEEGAVRMTDKGLAFAASRLDGPDSSSNYAVRSGGASYGPPSASFTLALKHMLLHANDYITKVIGIKST